ncbi:MAG: sulfotransferase [Erythrobacter sp.]
MTKFVNATEGRTDIFDLRNARKQLFAGNFQAAHAAAQRAIKADPSAVEAVLVMAAIAVEHGNGPPAERLCTLAANTGHRSCWLVLLEARVALLKQDQERARERALAASLLRTEDPHIANQLGVALSRTGRHADAVAPFRQAVRDVPDNADYRYNLAVALQFAGDLADAEAEFRELVGIAPTHAKGWGALVQLADAPDPDWEDRLADLFEASEDTETRLALGHALARLAEGREQWDASLVWLDRAKAAKAREVAYDRTFAEALADTAIEAGKSGEFAPEPRGDERPIFIVGMPRSGTTLVERILSSHPRVRSVGELSDFAILLKQALATPGQLVLEPALLEAAARAEDLSAVGDAYLGRVGQLAGDAPHFIDKMPFNAFFVPAIFRALPGARVVCLRRSPFDVLFANYRQLFATGFSYYSYAYDFGDTAHFVAGFERMADAFADSLPPGRFLPVRYEDVVADQRPQTERLLHFCGLEWDDACMEFHRNTQPVATASAVQVRSPIYASSVAKWRRFSDGAERAIGELGQYGLSP